MINIRGETLWQHPQAEQGHFAVYADGQRYDATNLTFIERKANPTEASVQYTVSRYANETIEVWQHRKIYEGTALSEVWQTVRNSASETLEVSRLDSFVWDIPQGDYKLLYYSGNWGSEFEGIEVALNETLVVETTTGRSSKGHHPWFALSSGASTLSGSLAWSGNWVFRFEPLPEGGFVIISSSSGRCRTLVATRSIICPSRAAGSHTLCRLVPAPNPG